MGRSVPVEERFWPKVDMRGDDECWPWLGYRDRRGYGKIRPKQSNSTKAHRVAWMLRYGSIPDGLCVLHHCDNPPCCNPHHLFLGTHLDNVADRHAKGRTASGEGAGMSAVPSELRPRGETHGRAVLTEAQVLAIRATYATGGTSVRALAREFNCSKSMVHFIVTNQNWTHV
jgi:hypothetical protein